MNVPTALTRGITQVRAASQLLLSTAGIHQAENRITADAQRFWRDRAHSSWHDDSHLREAPIFQGNDLWSEMGSRHLQLLQQGRRLTGHRPEAGLGRVVDWGCGGGVNAVQLAPLAQQIIGVDVSTETLAECAERVAETSTTPFQPVLIDVAEPESALARITEPCDAFVSFYVFEIFPTPEYGERILRIAHSLLAPHGLALIHIAYDTGSWRTRPRRRDYRWNPSAMTTYPLDGFWQMARLCGMTPQWLHLLPTDAVGERYAYVLLQKAGDDDLTAPTKT